MIMGTAQKKERARSAAPVAVLQAREVESDTVTIPVEGVGRVTFEKEGPTPERLQEVEVALRGGVTLKYLEAKPGVKNLTPDEMSAIAVRLMLNASKAPRFVDRRALEVAAEESAKREEHRKKISQERIRKMREALGASDGEGAERDAQETKMYIIISKSNGGLGGVYSTKKAAEEDFAKLAETTKADSFIAGEAKELSELTIPALTALYNEVAQKTIKRFDDKSEKTLRRVWDAYAAKHEPKKAEPKAKRANGAKKGDGRPRGGSKMAKLLERLEKGEASAAQLMQASGFDENNLRTAIGILRSGRGGRSYDVKRDDESGKYSL